jgi:hypothetical protein
MPEPTALITSLILDRPTCLDCLATKAGMGLADVEAALDRIATAVRPTVPKFRLEKFRLEKSKGLGAVYPLIPIKDVRRRDVH